MEIPQIIDSFSKKHILVIGDIILDKYVFGKVSRINPEAPVPILNAVRTEYRLGGAANVANNIASLGGKATVIGRIGNDQGGKIITEYLNQENITQKTITSNLPTTIKTRILARGQQLVRIDWEENKKITFDQVKKIIDETNFSEFDAIIISDYNKGMITKELMQEIKKTNKKIVVDPKPENIDLYKGCFAITPNLKEASELTNTESVEIAGEKLREKTESNVIITRADSGASLFDSNGHYHVNAKTKEVYDVSGAGDTFISVFALAITVIKELKVCVELANAAGGIAVEKLGTSTINNSELKNSFTNLGKLLSIEQLTPILKKAKQKNKKVIFTSGSFDVITMNHVKLLNKAKEMGDLLIVGLNTDESIRKYRQEKKTVHTENERAEILLNMSCVDYLSFFDETDPSVLISKIKPSVYVKGGSYSPEDEGSMPEAKLVKEYGGKIVILPL